MVSKRFDLAWAVTRCVDTMAQLAESPVAPSEQAAVAADCSSVKGTARHIVDPACTKA